MKALIFGAGGQLGRALAATVPAGVDATSLCRSDCDIGDAAAVTAAIDAAAPDIVLNAAAYTAVDKAESDIAAARLINAQAPGVIAAVSRKVGARMAHVSTDFVFRGTGAHPLRPDDPTDPIGVYGLTKRDGEIAVLDADPHALIVRTAWVYAAEGANFLNTMLRLMAERERLGVVADQIGTPTWATSLARALWGLIAANARGVHHFTDAGVASWYDFAVAIAEEAAAIGLLADPARIDPIRTQDYPTPARRPAYGVLDKTDSWALLGGPAPHWRANLRACLKEKHV